MDVAILLVSAFVAFLATAKWAHSALEARRRRGHFDEPPVTTIAESPKERVVQIVGRAALAGEPLSAAIHGRPAVFVRIRADGQPSVHASAPATRLESFDRWADVELRDDTGTLRLDPASARLELDPDRHDAREHITHFFGATSPAVADLLASRGLDEHGERWRHVHLYEWIVEPGARIAVLGTIESGDGPYRGTPTLRARRIRLLD